MGRGMAIQNAKSRWFVPSRLPGATPVSLTGRALLAFAMAATTAAPARSDPIHLDAVRETCLALHDTTEEFHAAVQGPGWQRLNVGPMPLDALKIALVTLRTEKNLTHMPDEIDTHYGVEFGAPHFASFNAKRELS